MFRYLFLIIIILFFSMGCFAFDIAKDGKPACNVVLKDGATKAEVYACNEFVKYIEKISGAKLSVSSLPKKDANNVFIGKTETAKSIAKIKDWNDIKDDEIIIVSKDNNLILSGGKGSGVIYSVYDFLDEYLGVKFLTNVEEYVPEMKAVKVGDINKKYISPFFSREVYYKHFQDDPYYCLKLKTNGHFCNIPKEYGGHISLYGFAHTFSNLVSRDKYSKDHPEWYAYRDGKRDTVNSYGQLCLTNEEMVNELTKNVLEEIKANPNEKIFSVTQNDCPYYCECDNCVVAAEKYGQSGVLLNVINEVAKEVKKQYPNVLIETFAYQHTRHAPKGGVKPADNVLIRLCSIECDFAKTFDEKVNLDFYKDLKDWSKISNQLYVWDYRLNNGNLVIIHPDFRSYQKNIQIMRDNKVIGVFEQGEQFNDNGCFQNYKKYILAKLLWDPNLNVDKETKTFLSAYYGDGANDMYNLLNYINKIMAKTDFKLHLNPTFHPYFKANDWIYCFNCFNSALKKTENTKYYDKIKFDMLCFQAGLLYCDKKEALKVYKGVDLMYPDPAEYLNYIKTYLPEHGYLKQSEYTYWKDGIYNTFDFKNIKEGPTPKECEGLKDSDWVEFHGDKINAWGTPERQKTLSVPDASNGKAKFLSSAYDELYVQQTMLPQYLDKDIKGGDVYITYKILNPKGGSCLRIGLYDPHGDTDYNPKEIIFEKDIDADPNLKDKWITEKICKVDFMNCGYDSYVFAACCGNAEGSDGVLIDRIFMILDK